MDDGLLVAGGSADPNLVWLAEAAAALGVEYRTVLIDPDRPPDFCWHLDGALHVDGVRLDCQALFCRHDVFATLANPDPMLAGAVSAWHASLIGYGLSRDLKMFNRSIDAQTASKPAMLGLAARHGFAVPETVITNGEAHLPDSHGGWIAKPVAGGSYVMQLTDALAKSGSRSARLAAPAIVQPELSYPERRVYRISDSLYVFDIRSRTVDSRLDGNCEIVPLPLSALPDGMPEKLIALTDAVRCDFGAIDLKTAANGELTFLELNNGPMFVGYDRTTGGVMARKMVEVLTARH